MCTVIIVVESYPIKKVTPTKGHEYSNLFVLDSYTH